MAEQVNNPAFSGVAGGTISAFTLVKRHTDNTILNSGANEQAVGVATQDAVATDVMGVRGFSAGPLFKVKAKGDSANIAIGDILVGGASGKAIKLPAAAGTYYQIGVAQQACTADGDIITAAPIGVGQKHVVA
jgi:hypothetical protein